MSDSRRHALYRFFDRSDALVYVGITLDLPSRLRRHNQTKDWWHTVTRVEVEPHPDRESALAAEEKAIRTEHPLHNVAHNGGTRKIPEAAGPSTRFGLEVGFAVALMTTLPTSTKCYVGEVQAIDDYGVRITLINWFLGMFTSNDLFVPWVQIVGAAVWTEEHHVLDDDLPRWQNTFHGKNPDGSERDE